MSTATLEREDVATNGMPVAATPAPGPEEVKVNDNPLFMAMEKMTNEIEECDKGIAEAEAEYKAAAEALAVAKTAKVEKLAARREQVKIQTHSWFKSAQEKFGFVPKKTRKTKARITKPEKTSSRHDKSVKVLIAEFLEKHRNATTKEIRNHLQALGKTTNPGVELSRMVKEGTIKNVERGKYTLGRAG